MHPPEETQRTSPRSADTLAAARTGGVVCAIPARFASLRLPGKVLIEIAGRPMIEHVYRRAEKASGIAAVIVLTDDERVKKVVEGFGGSCQMTPQECGSGTDRIAWAARDWPCRAVINVQGDEPLLDPADVSRLAARLDGAEGASMVTLAAEATEEELADPDTVKVVTDLAGRALYFSRSPIPYQRRAVAKPLRHIGIYGYRRDILLRLAALEPSPLEQSESLEQLRALENGIAIAVLETEHSGIGVDTPEDLRRVEQLLRERGTVVSEAM